MLCILALAVSLAATPGDELAELAAAGRWETLREVVDQRLEQDATDARARFWLGREQLEQAWGLLAGDRVARDIGRAVLERAIAELGRARRDGEEQASDWGLQARFSRWELGEPGVTGGRDAVLLPELERAWREDARPMAAYLRGLAASQRPDDDPLPWLQRAARSDPATSLYALAWCRELAAAGDRDGALAAWSLARAAGDWQLDELLAALLLALPAGADAERRLALLDELKADPRWRDEALLAWHRAHTLMLLDRPQAAARAFEEGSTGTSAASDRARAALLGSLDRPQQALQLLFARARQRHWDCLDDAVSIADGLAIARRFDEALAAYDTALSIEPRHERALWHRALARWQAGRPSAAAAWADLVERFPGRSDILNDAALAAWGAGDEELARRRLELAVAWPGSRDARENLAVLLLSQTPADEIAALRWLTDVLEQQPGRDRSLLYRYRARCLALSRGR